MICELKLYTSCLDCIWLFFQCHRGGATWESCWTTQVTAPVSDGFVRSRCPKSIGCTHQAGGMRFLKCEVKHLMLYVKKKCASQWTFGHFLIILCTLNNHTIPVASEMIDGFWLFALIEQMKWNTYLLGLEPGAQSMYLDVFSTFTWRRVLQGYTGTIILPSFRSSSMFSINTHISAVLFKQTSHSALPIVCFCTSFWSHL